MSRFQPQYSIQQLLDMDIEQNVYRRCIDEVKSPLQTFNISHSTIDSGTKSKIYNSGSPEHAYSTISSFHQVSIKQQERKRSMSRTRKRIFDNTVKQRKEIAFGNQECITNQYNPIIINNYPSFNKLNNFTIQNNTKIKSQNKQIPQIPLISKMINKNQIKNQNQIINSNAMNNGSEVGCWDMCMNHFPSNSNLLDQIKTSRSQQINIKQYNPINYYHTPKPLEKLHYSNSNIPHYQTQFISFLLKIIPKLYLRNQLATNLFVNKTQLLQSLLTQPYKYQRQQAINNIFSAGKMNRIDKRFDSPDLNQFISRLTMTSHKPINNYAQQKVISTIQKIVDLLNQVQEDIKQYLTSNRRVQQLQQIYQQINFNNDNNKFKDKTLCLLIYEYLNNKEVSCRQSNIQTLSYIWSNIKYRSYSKQQFINQITKNDIIIKTITPQESELQRQLTKMGFIRNA